MVDKLILAHHKCKTVYHKPRSDRYYKYTYFKYCCIRHILQAKIKDTERRFDIDMFKEVNGRLTFRKD